MHLGQAKFCFEGGELGLAQSACLTPSDAGILSPFRLEPVQKVLPKWKEEPFNN
jgi:hypothetical protein